MSVRNLLYNVICISFLLTSCDEISENERFIEVAPVTVARTVLVEEFSGEQCVNCPKGAEALHEIQNSLGEENVVVVTIHAGRFGMRPGEMDGFAGLMTDMGNTLYNNSGAPAQPSIVVDRRSGGIEAGLQPMSMWLTPIRDAMAVETPLSLQLSAVFDRAEGVIKVSAAAESSLDVAGRIHVWLTESGIVGAQLDDSPEGGKWNYVHNHVFRTAVDGIDGMAFNMKFGDEPKAYTYSIRPEDKWNVANMDVVVFVSDATGVLQTAATHVVVEE